MLRRDRAEKEGGVRRFLGLKRVLAANVVIFAVVAWGLAGEFLRNRDMQREIDRLDGQASQMEKKNSDLQDLGQRFSSQAMLEREARTKLNLQKPGEQVVIVRDGGRTDDGAEIEPAAGAAADEDQGPGNAAKWWRYFFR
jgi:cell division protein FtsB